MNLAALPMEMPLVQASDVTVEVLDGELVLYSPHDQSLHHLNGTAALVWDCLAEAVTRTDLVSDFCQAFGLAPDAARGHLDDVIGPLLSAGAISTRSDPTAQGT
jgi:hypothetical protein